MHKSILTYFFVFFMTVSCASKNTVAQKQTMEGNPPGNIFRLENITIEVIKKSPSKLYFHFYTSEGVLIPSDEIQLQDGIVDPEDTKANYSIVFVKKEKYYEGWISKTKAYQEKEIKISVIIKYQGKLKRWMLPVHSL